MTCWSTQGDAICGSCGETGPGHSVRSLAIDYLRVLGWHHSKGVTLGGVPYEEILCPGCAKGQKKRSRHKIDIEQDALPLDWGTPVAVKGHGYASQ